MHKAFLLIFALSANSEIFCYLCIGHIFALLLILLTILGAPKNMTTFLLLQCYLTNATTPSQKRPIK